MNGVRTLEDLFRTDQSTAQTAPRKKAERGEFANQFLALLFDEKNSQGSVAAQQRKGGRDKAAAGEKGADRSPDTDPRSSGQWAGRFDLRHELKGTEQSEAKAGESESVRVGVKSDGEEDLESTNVPGRDSGRRLGRSGKADQETRAAENDSELPQVRTAELSNQRTEASFGSALSDVEYKRDNSRPAYGHLSEVTGEAEGAKHLFRAGKRPSAESEGVRAGDSGSDGRLRGEAEHGRSARPDVAVPESDESPGRAVDQRKSTDPFRGAGSNSEEVSESTLGDSVAEDRLGNLGSENEVRAESGRTAKASPSGVSRRQSAEWNSVLNPSSPLDRKAGRPAFEAEVQEKAGVSRLGSKSESVEAREGRDVNDSSASAGRAPSDSASASSSKNSASARASFQASLLQSEEASAVQTPSGRKSVKGGHDAKGDAEGDPISESRRDRESLKPGAHGSRIGAPHSRPHRTSAQQQSSAKDEKGEAPQGEDPSDNDLPEVSEKSSDHSSMARTLKSELGSRPTSHVRAAAGSPTAHTESTTHWIPGATERVEHASANARVPEKHARTLSGDAAPDRIFDQIVQATRLERQAGMERFTVTLKPAFLGRIEIETDFSSDDGVRALIRVEDPAVKKAVEKGLVDLLDQLGEQGVNIGSAEVSDFQNGDGERDADQSAAASSRRNRIRSSAVEPSGETDVSGTAGSDDGVFSYFA